MLNYLVNLLILWALSYTFGMAVNDILLELKWTTGRMSWASKIFLGCIFLAAIGYSFDWNLL